MNISENLQILRKKASLSQEELAEKLEVSRQAVSKWETGEAIPDMEKIIILSSIFNCSIDTLIKGKISDVKVLNNKDSKESYDKFMNKFSTGISLGVFLILMGVTVLLFMLCLEFSVLVSVATLLIFIIMAVPIFIVLGIKNESILKKYKNLTDNFYNQEEIDSFNSKFAIGLAICVSIILVGALVLILLYGFKIFADTSLIPVSIFMIFIMVAVPILVKIGILKSKYELINLKIHYQLNKDVEDKIGKICAVIMISATIVYFILGFIFKLWHINWLVYPIGGMICGIVSIIFSQD